MGKVKPPDKENCYFLRKPLKEDSLKNVLMDILQLMAKSYKRRHSVSDIPSTRFIVSTVISLASLSSFESPQRPAQRHPSLLTLAEEPEEAVSPRYTTSNLKIIVADGTKRFHCAPFN